MWDNGDFFVILKKSVFFFFWLKVFTEYYSDMGCCLGSARKAQKIVYGFFVLFF